jgi:hypothetical protein
MDPKTIKEKLYICQMLDVGHEKAQYYVLEPCIDEAEIIAFEEHHRIRLPEDYRTFISKLGNGGVGPKSLLPLGKYDLGDGYPQIGNMNAAFPYEKLVTVFRDTMKNGEEESELDAWSEQLNRVWSMNKPVNGALPICDTGCKNYIWIVITGSGRGQIWEDERASANAWYPTGLSFAQWYETWLEETLAWGKKQLETQLSVWEPLSNNRTPVTYAIELGWLDSLKHLAKRGAPMDIPDARGLRPIDIAVKSGSVKAIQLVKLLGGTIDKTVIEEAKRMERADILNALQES